MEAAKGGVPEERLMKAASAEFLDEVCLDKFIVVRLSAPRELLDALCSTNNLQDRSRIMAQQWYNGCEIDALDTKVVFPWRWRDQAQAI